MRKSVSLYARIKAKYIKLILKGFKMIEEKERYIFKLFLYIRDQYMSIRC